MSIIQLKKRNYVKRKVKAEMMDEVVLGVGFTADGWESRAGYAFLGITGHFVNSDYQLRRLTISCCPFEEAHTGENIKGILTKEVTKVRLGPGVAKTMVTDEASNMKKGRKLEHFWNLNCSNHKLQNCIKDARAYPENVQVDKMIQKATNLLTYARKSHFFHNKRKIRCKENHHQFSRLQGVSNVHWNCTYQMLKRLLFHKDCIQKMDDNRDVPEMPILEIAGWRLLREIVPMLYPIEYTTKVWEHDTEPTIQLVGQEVYNLQERLVKTIKEKSTALRQEDNNPQDDPGVKFAKSLLASIKKRFPNYGLRDDLTAWASLLDPKQKKVLLDEVNLTEVTKRTLEDWWKTLRWRSSQTK